MRTLPQCLLALATAALAACTTPQAPFETLDVTRLEGARIAVIIARPADVPFRSYATLNLTATGAGGEVAEAFALAPSVERSESDRIIQAFALGEADRQRFAETQAALGALKERDPTTSGSLSVNAGLCDNADFGSAPVPISVWLRLTPDSPPTPVVQDLDITRIRSDTPGPGCAPQAGL